MAEDGGSSTETEMTLRQQCEDIWDELHQLRGQVPDVPPVTVESGSETLQILRATEAAMMARIEVLQDSESQVLPPGEQLQYEVLHGELTKTVNELLSVLKMEKAGQQEAEVDIARQKKRLTELTAGDTALKSKLAKLREQHRSVAHSDESLLKELHGQHKNICNFRKQLTKELKLFTQTHFHLPSGEEFEAWKEKNQVENMEITNLQTIQNILKELMNKAINTPHDPYISVTEECWPPYIELLLRLGIALQQPHDCARIKLTPFHL